MFTKKRFIIIFAVSFFLVISGAGLNSPAYADEDTYEKVWDSGSTTSNRINDVDVGDIDGDGHPEIIVSDQPPGGGGKIYVFENTGNNSYELVWDSGNILTMRVIHIAIGDQDNDGYLEIIAAESKDIPPHNAKLHVFENVGDNDYQEVWHSGSDLNGMEVASIFLGDADNDGKREILIGAGYHWSVCKLRIYENTGDNAYQAVWNSGSSLLDTVTEGAVGDTDGDGSMEIIVGSGGIEKEVRVFECNGDNSYQLVSKIRGFGKSPQATIGDQDKDGSMEIIVGSQEGENAVRVFEHTGSIGDNTYTEVWNSGTLAARIGLPAFGDQDHDGKREIIAPCLDAHKVYLFENTGDNDYQEVWNSGNVMKGLVERSVAGDQDRDGKGEIIAVSYDGKVYVFEYWENQPPVVDAGLNQTMEQETYEGTEVIQIGHATDADGDALTYQWKEGETVLASGAIPAPNEPPTDADVTLTHILPPGEHTVTLTVSDGEISSSDDVLIIVEDTTPPEISVSVSPDVLWPPNHKMVNIQGAVTVSDIGDPAPTWTLVSITSNEPEEGPGKKHSPDIMGYEPGTPDLEFQLRAERLGQGEGRIYTITYQATDSSGNSVSTEVIVIVPHDMGKGKK